MEENINFIDHHLIERLLARGRAASEQEQNLVIEKAFARERLSPEDLAVLLFVERDTALLEQLFELAGTLKREIYGDRIVIFAPLYVSNFCVNNCVYCGYRRDNQLQRRKLSFSEIEEEVRVLLRMGHKRLAFEVGEDPQNCGMDYILEAIRTIYQTTSAHGSIRRVNVNIAATTHENYRALKEAEIGTYILFQETYHKPTYEATHPKSLKSSYEYHLNAFDRAMEAGIDDVGSGVLFGLADWRYEVLGLMLHNAHLEDRFGVGFHTISVPRMKRAEGVSLEDFPYLIDDVTFKKIIAILRIAVPYTGLILSTRESAELRREMVRYGVSQISAGSSTGVGGYRSDEASLHTEQFEVEDHRKPLEVLKELLKEGYVPSYCTACYRSGRTGDRFMQLARSGNIQNVCLPNGLMTLMEYAMDFGDEEISSMVRSVCNREIDKIKSEKMRNYTRESLDRIEQGERDFFV